MTERLKFEGRLSEKERDSKRLKLKINGLLRSMRDLLDPFVEPVELYLDVVAEQAIEIRAAQINLIEVEGEIKELKKALGR